MMETLIGILLSQQKVTERGKKIITLSKTAVDRPQVSSDLILAPKDAQRV